PAPSAERVTIATSDVASVCRLASDQQVAGHGALEEPSVTLAADVAAPLDDHLATGQDDLGCTRDLASLVAGVVNIHVMGRGGDGVDLRWVVHHQAGTRPCRYAPLATGQSEHPGGGRGADLHPTLLADASGDDPAI